MPGLGDSTLQLLNFDTNLVSNLIQTMSRLTTLARRNAKAHRQAPQFRQLFNLPLSQFWHSITGFDIVKFDDAIKPGSNQSLKDCIESKYGREAVQLIKDLIES